jgi:hypothetical protein
MLPDQPNISEITRNISKNSLPLLIGGFGFHLRASRQVVNDIFAGAAMPSPMKSPDQFFVQEKSFPSCPSFAVAFVQLGELA